MNEELPNITGSFNGTFDAIRLNTSVGCLKHSSSKAGTYNAYGNGQNWGDWICNFNAQESNDIYTNSGNVHPSSISTYYFIKY